MDNDNLAAEEKRPDIIQWQTDQGEWFDPTIREIVGEYAAWRDAQEAAASPDTTSPASLDTDTAGLVETVLTRDDFGMAMLAAWLNVEVGHIPPENRAHLNPHTMAAWQRVGEAANRYFTNTRTEGTTK